MMASEKAEDAGGRALSPRRSRDPGRRGRDQGMAGALQRLARGLPGRAARPADRTVRRGRRGRRHPPALLLRLRFQHPSRRGCVPELQLRDPRRRRGDDRGGHADRPGGADLRGGSPARCGAEARRARIRPSRPHRPQCLDRRRRRHPARHRDRRRCRHRRRQRRHARRGADGATVVGNPARPL